jgi:hypothetical protein
MNTALVQALVAKHKLSIFCASCRRYWDARLAGVPGHACLIAGACGSPLVGDDFGQYDGPITDRARWCFVCGEAADLVVEAVGKRACGLCRAHAHVTHSLQSWSPEAVAAQPRPSARMQALLDVLREPGKGTG